MNDEWIFHREVVENFVSPLLAKNAFQLNSHHCQMVRDPMLKSMNCTALWQHLLYLSLLCDADIVKQQHGRACRECERKPGTCWLCLGFHLLTCYTTAAQLLLSLLHATCQARAYLIVCPPGCYQMNLSRWRGGAAWGGDDDDDDDDKDDDVLDEGLGFGKPATPAPPHQWWMSYEMERRSERIFQFSCRQRGLIMPRD